MSEHDPSERHAALEVRIRQRVVDRCVAAARTALDQNRFDDAQAALEEAIALDAHQPDLRALSAELTERRRQPVERRLPPAQPRPHPMERRAQTIELRPVTIGPPSPASELRLQPNEPQAQTTELRLRPSEPRPHPTELRLKPIELRPQSTERRPQPPVRQTQTRWWSVAIVVLAAVAVLTFVDRRTLPLPSSDQLKETAAGSRTDVVARSSMEPASAGLPPADEPLDRPSAESSATVLVPALVEEPLRSDDVEDAAASVTERAAPSVPAPRAAAIELASNMPAPAPELNVSPTTAMPPAADLNAPASTAPGAPDLYVAPASATPPAADLNIGVASTTRPPADVDASARATVSPPAAASPLEPSRSETPRTADVVAPLPNLVRPVNESLLVEGTLQRYRAGYDHLDADLVQSVYPAVDRSPLARAFKELASQSLVFDVCDIDIHGALASATCRGTARYVPKIGSSEPRVEHRVWTFTLRRSANDWIIDRARTSR